MINDIRLQNFRSYQDDSFEFADGVNIVVGPNASGKTNLLEALLVLCLGSSYRVRDQDLVRYGQPWTRLDAYIGSSQRSIKLAIKDDLGGPTKTLVIDSQEFKRITQNRTLPVVLFEPQHLTLISGSPELRRSFLDDLLEQTVPGFGLIRRQYKRTLAQRNALLKSHTGQPEQLFAWNIRLSELGGHIAVARQSLLERFNERLPELYSEIAHHETKLSIGYESACSITQYSSDMLHKLEQSAERDSIRGYTSHGPHRDDLVFLLNGRRVQETASRGEVRSLLLTLKIVELQLIHDVRNQSPVLLLDDVFSELDGARRRALTRFLQPYQTFITTTDADVVVQHFMDDCRIIPLGSG